MVSNCPLCGEAKKMLTQSVLVAVPYEQKIAVQHEERYVHILIYGRVSIIIRSVKDFLHKVLLASFFINEIVIHVLDMAQNELLCWSRIIP